jgi:hypothetical protein
MTHKQFDFLNTSYSISADIKQIIGFIESALPAKSMVNELLFKAKIIVTELLTNSLKHSGINSTIIDVSLNDNLLTISKTDFGNPLNLITKNYPANIKIPITNDILHTLYAVIDSGKHVTFFCDENNMADILAIENIVEHFGLLIITKSADRFTYHFNEQTKKNIFVAMLRF